MLSWKPKRMFWLANSVEPTLRCSQIQTKLKLASKESLLWSGIKRWKAKRTLWSTTLTKSMTWSANSIPTLTTLRCNSQISKLLHPSITCKTLNKMKLRKLKQVWFSKLPCQNFCLFNKTIRDLCKRTKCYKIEAWNKHRHCNQYLTLSLILSKKYPETHSPDNSINLRVLNTVFQFNWSVSLSSNCLKRTP